MNRSLRDLLALALLDRSHVVLAPSRNGLTRLVQELPKAIASLKGMERISAERFVGPV